MRVTLPPDLVAAASMLPHDRPLAQADAIEHVQRAAGIPEWDGADASAIIARLVHVRLAEWTTDGLTVHDPRKVQQRLDDLDAAERAKPPYEFHPDPKPELDPLTRQLVAAEVHRLLAEHDTSKDPHHAS